MVLRMSDLDATFTILKLTGQTQMQSRSWSSDLCRLRVDGAQRTGVPVVDLACTQITTRKGEEDWGLLWKYGLGKR